MDHISVRKAERLYWLGRYAERAYSLCGRLMGYFDRMIDQDPGAYTDFCTRMGIADRYGNQEAFICHVISDVQDSASVAYALCQSNDNAMVLRDELKTETSAYIQLAYNAVTRLFEDNCRVCDLQDVKDLLLAFWGAVDDFIIDDKIRSLLKAGKYTERIDLYARFDCAEAEIADAESRLRTYIARFDASPASTEVSKVLSSQAPSAHEINSWIIDLIQ